MRATAPGANHPVAAIRFDVVDTEAAGQVLAIDIVTTETGPVEVLCTMADRVEASLDGQSWSALGPSEGLSLGVVPPGRITLQLRCRPLPVGTTHGRQVTADLLLVGGV